MSVSEALLSEFNQEIANTRKTLERVPEDKLGWKPHEKSGTMAWLAGHLADLGSWAMYTVKQDSVDVAPPGEPPMAPFIPKSVKELLERFDKNSADARQALAGLKDSDLGKPWSLLQGGKTLMTMPKAVCLRFWCFNHLIHHRAQLGVYLRLNNVPVPAIYGPSADEQGM